MKTYGNYFNGEWVDAVNGGTFPTINPFNGESLAHVALGLEEDVDLAVKAARTAFDKGEWSGMDPRDRAAYFFKLEQLIADESMELAEAETMDTGMLIRLTSGMVVPMLGVFCKRFAEMAEYLVNPESRAQADFPALYWDYIVREPLGVIGCIVPWNFPLFLACWKIFPAMIAGNCVVLKPSSHAPLSLIHLARLIDKLGLPKGVFNLVNGPGSKTGDALVLNPSVNKISMTGSSAIGKDIMAKASIDLKRITLELGGKNPALVLDDANLEMTADGILYGGLLHQGQVCMSGSRIYVPKTLYSDLNELLIERAKTLVLGDPLDIDTDQGPLINDRRRQTVMNYIQQGIDEGATLLLGGKIPEDETLKNGFFLQPTLFGDATQQMVISREEIFGPVIALIPYESEKEAVQMANDTCYGLNAGIWSGDVERANQLARQLQAGTVFINDWHTLNPEYPFGGYKQSGLGREGGLEGFYEFTQSKTVHINFKQTRDDSHWFKILLGNAD